jgi:hypothetical protein
MTRDRLVIPQLDFHLHPGDRESWRRGCYACGIPIAFVQRGYRQVVINQDGTPHAASCTHLYAVRRRSLSQR